MRLPNVNVLQHVEQTAARSVFGFDPALQRYSTDNPESSYQLQLAARYSF
jgi:hypothetical protein